MEAELIWPAASGTIPLATKIPVSDMGARRIDRIRPVTRIRAGDVFRCPDQGDAAIVQSGTLVVELMMTCGNVLRLARYGVGDVVPTLDRLSTPAFSLSYRAEEQTQITWLRNDGIGGELVDRAANARDTLLFAAMRQITALACLPAAYRLYVEILRHAATTANETAFELPTHGELASRACTTRETISREISMLKREGVLSQGKDVRLLSPSDLTKRIARALNLDDDADVWESMGIAPIGKS